MNGVYISTRPVRVSLATARKPASANTGMPASTPASNLPGVRVNLCARAWYAYMVLHLCMRV
jgi:hypothetical protein